MYVRLDTNMHKQVTAFKKTEANVHTDSRIDFEQVNRHHADKHSQSVSQSNKQTYTEERGSNYAFLLA